MATAQKMQPRKLSQSPRAVLRRQKRARAKVEDAMKQQTTDTKKSVAGFLGAAAPMVLQLSDEQVGRIAQATVQAASKLINPQTDVPSPAASPAQCEPARERESVISLQEALIELNREVEGAEYLSERCYVSTYGPIPGESAPCGNQAMGMIATLVRLTDRLREANIRTNGVLKGLGR